MKRYTALFVALCVLCLTACSSNDATPPAPTSTTPTVPANTPIPGANLGSLKLSPVTVEVPPGDATGNFTSTRQINLPAGFGIKVFTTGLQHVRELAISPDGVLYASVTAENRVVKLPDANNDGVADSVITVADNLQGVHGLAFDKNGVLYAATSTSVFKLEDPDSSGKMQKITPIISDLPIASEGPPGANHSTRSIQFGPDGMLYVSIGSPCNACPATDPRRAAITRYSPDGKLDKVFASGIRNAVGITFHPVTGELWAVVNERDGLGPDIPPDPVFNVKEGGNYGWPYCFGMRVPDPELKPPAGTCDKVDLPAFLLPAHYAPLGDTFYYGKSFPADYTGVMFLTSHGSWDRTIRYGYKLMIVHFKDNEPDTSMGANMIEDFATGWLLDPVSGEHWGRPVDPIVAPDGSLFLTDDASMSIYKIYYKGATGN